MPSSRELPHQDRLEFSYRLTGVGWAEATISDASGSATVTASYLSDALRDLLDAVDASVAGAGHAECVFEEEPGEYRWSFDRVGDRILLRITAFGMPRDQNGNETEEEDLEWTVFETRVSAGELRSSIAAGARRALGREGADGYQRKWMEHPFPIASLRRLEGSRRVGRKLRS